MEKTTQAKAVEFIKGHKKLFTFVGLSIIALFLYNVLLGYNTATQLLVKQSPTGTLSCVDHAG